MSSSVTSLPDTTVTSPMNSLELLPSVMVPPAPAARVVVPVTISCEVCVIVSAVTVTDEKL